MQLNRTRLLFQHWKAHEIPFTGGVAILTGEGAPDTMGDEVPADDDMDMEPTVDADAEAEALKAIWVMSLRRQTHPQAVKKKMIEANGKVLSFQSV